MDRTKPVPLSEHYISSVCQSSMPSQHRDDLVTQQMNYLTCCSDSILGRDGNLAQCTGDVTEQYDWSTSHDVDVNAHITVRLTAATYSVIVYPRFPIFMIQYTYFNCYNRASSKVPVKSKKEFPGNNYHSSLYECWAKKK
ncbi:Protein of unknown function [Gryllus bimaculatus]|nr:Protein of unknown function [Gryllus bimaculatus]